MNRRISKLTIAVIAGLVLVGGYVLIRAIIIAHDPAAALAQCTVTDGHSTNAAIPNGQTIIVQNTKRMFITLPRALYPDSDLQILNSVNGATMSYVTTGNFANNLNSPCWTHYYQFKLVGNATGTYVGSFDVSVKSAIKNIPDYLLHVTISD